MQSLTCCTLLLSFSILCWCDLRIQQKNWSENDNRRALECLESLIDVTDWRVHNFLLISDGTDVVDHDFFKRYQNFAWNLYSRGNNNLTGFFNVIIFANNFHNLNETLNAISIRRINSQTKVVINVMENFASLDEIKSASEGITAAMWKLDKTLVVYLVACKGDVLVMTDFPFAMNCKAGELEVLYTWRGENFEKEANLFPDKMLDIHGCVQNHSTIFDNVTKLQIRKESTDTGEIILGGIGGQLMNIIAEKMNMKLHLLPDQPASWDLLIQQIILDESLFSAGGTIPMPAWLEFFDMNVWYMEESFAFGYVNTGVEVSWKNIVWPLNNEVWGYMGFTLLLYSGLIFLLNRRDWRVIAPDQFTFLDNFGILLGSSRVLPRSYYGRYLVGMWIVYSLLTSAFYNCGFVSFLTTQNDKRIINTLEDLLADGIDFGGGAFHRGFYHDPSDPVMMKIYDNFKIWSDDESQSLLINGQGVTGVVNSFLYMYNSNRTGDVSHQLHILKEKAFTYHVPIFMRRGSPFTFSVHRYALQAIQSGLTDYWLKYYTRISWSTAIGTKTPTVITTRHLRGIFYLFIAGLSFSSVIFFGELIFDKYFSNRGGN